MKILKIYTDGAYKPSRGIGAAAFVILEENDLLTESCKVYSSERLSSNRMELQAVINALNWLRSNGYKPKNYRVYVYTDSQYVQLGMNEWIHNWKRKKWVKPNGEEIKNLDLWKYLYNLIRDEFESVHIQWIEGHRGNPWNTQVDNLCKVALKQYVANNFDVNV